MLPTRCFISHAYEDSDVCERLIAALPRGIEPVRFPPILVPPSEFVSSSLIDAILECDGLLYLRGGHSEESFWVAFERDYALRAGKAVFAVDPISLEITAATGSPLDLAVRMFYLSEDSCAVGEIQRFLTAERHFDVLQDQRAGYEWAQQISKSFGQLRQRGGYFVAFLSKAWKARDLDDTFFGHEFAELMNQAGTSGVPDLAADPRNRLLFATLDGTPPPFEDWTGAVVDLRGDGELSFNQKIDDLMVRLYWLTTRTSNPG